MSARQQSFPLTLSDITYPSVSQPEEPLPVDVDSISSASGTHTAADSSEESEVREVSAHLSRSHKDRSQYTRWTPDMDSELLRLVDINMRDNVIYWAVIVDKIGRMKCACKNSYQILRSKDKQSAVDKITDQDSGRTGSSESTCQVTSVIQAVRESGYPIDWTAVAGTAGETESECIESNTYHERKQRWSYDKDTSAWDVPNKMHDFINKHYPNLALPDFAAVWNYLWIAIEDCIDMYRRTKKPFRWTDEIGVKVAGLKRVECTNDEIARHISPILKGNDVADRFARLRHSSLARSLTGQQKDAFRASANVLVNKTPYADTLKTVKIEFLDV